VGFDQLLELVVTASATVAGASGATQFLQIANLQRRQGVNDLRFPDLQTGAHDPIRASVTTFVGRKKLHGRLSKTVRRSRLMKLRLHLNSNERDFRVKLFSVFCPARGSAGAFSQPPSGGFPRSGVGPPLTAGRVASRGSALAFFGRPQHEANQKFGHKVLEWQTGYGVVSFGTRDLDWVKDYVKNQRERHHRGRIEDRLERINTESSQAEAEPREAP
jgi:hypothetical protein